MNRVGVIEKIASEAGISQKAAKAALKATLEAIESSLVAGDEVQLVNFGTFRVKHAPKRVARNPQTGVTIDVPACRKPVFTAGKKLKEVVNNT